jgi:hypothetical protein
MIIGAERPEGVAAEREYGKIYFAILSASAGND